MRTDNFLPYGKQDIDEHDISAVCRALRSDIITRGASVEAFECAVASWCGAGYAVAFNSGTAALAAACHAIDLCAHDRVILPPNTFVATVAPVIHAGATPIFVDIDRNTGNLNLDQVEGVLETQPTRGRTVVMPVHFSGIAVDMQQLESMLNRPEMVLIEDAAHALGSLYPSGEKVGSCAYSAMTIFSFHPVKNITCGEGGMVLTNDEELFRRLCRFRNNGIERDSHHFLGDERGPWYYEVQEITGNYNLTDIHAALGLSQMQRLPTFVDKRREHMMQYRHLLKDVPHVQLLSAAQDSYTAFHLAVAQIDFAQLGITREALMLQLKGRGIGTQVHYIPLYRHPYFLQHCGELSPYFPEMERYYSQALSLPLYSKLRPEQITYICETLEGLLKKKKLPSRRR